MLDKVIPFLNTQLDGLGYFDVLFNITETVKKGDRVYPAEWCGEWKTIEIDHYDGVGYWKKDSVSKTTESGTISCIDELEFSYDLRLIVCIPRKKLDTNDAFSEDRTAMRITREIENADLTTLKTDLQAINIDLEVTGWTTDNASILADEYNSQIEVRYEYLYMAIDVDAIITINENCIVTEC